MGDRKNQDPLDQHDQRSYEHTETEAAYTRPARDFTKAS